MVCEYFDPITASCAPCCVVCSRHGESCYCERKTAPVLAHEDGKRETIPDDSALILQAGKGFVNNEGNQEEYCL